MKHTTLPRVTLITSLLISLTLSPLALAKLYKTVDANGNVSFSDSPGTTSEGSTQKTIDMPKTVNTLPSSKSQTQMEQDFLQDADNRENTLREQWAAYDADMKQAKAELKTANKELENAQIPVEGDRVFTKTATGGFSRETAQRKERISGAEQAVAQAQQALQKARKSKPSQARPAKALKTNDDDAPH